MSDQKIIEENKLIAEFMGLKQVKTPKGELLWVKKEFNEIYNYGYENYDDTFDWGNFLPQTEKLSYYYSWDWLMPVVEKIESLDIRNNGYDFPKVKFLGDHVEIFVYATYRGTSFYWKNWVGISGNFHKHTNQLNSKIEAVWFAVVEFIKWYNENKSS